MSGYTTYRTSPRTWTIDGAFHYAVLGPGAASESGKPSAEARRFLDETSGPNRPRVFRNALLLLTPSRDGLEQAVSRVREYLAWDVVRGEVKEQQQDGGVDAARVQTLQVYLETARGRTPEAVRQAYSVVVSVSEKNEAQAFRMTVATDPHFNTIKSDKRARVQDTAITAEALLPGGPYDLWRSGETSRRVKDLAGAFAQQPHLPKMLRSGTILDTLVRGCEQGAFVLRLKRPDGTSRSWWMARPDAEALADPALELVLPQTAMLSHVEPELLSPGVLPGLWSTDEITVNAVTEYFGGGTVVEVDRGGYKEPMHVPKADPATTEAAVEAGVTKGTVWLLSGPASILGEAVPTGILNGVARLRRPPAPVAAAAILPENTYRARGRMAWPQGSPWPPLCLQRRA